MTWEELQGKIVWGVITALVAGMGYLTTVVVSAPSRAEVQSLLETERQHYVKALENFSGEQAKLTTTIEKLKDKIEDMRILIERYRRMPEPRHFPDGGNP